MSWIVLVLILVGNLITAYLFFNNQKKTNSKVTILENKIKNLAEISKYFPQFIQEGKRVSSNITSDLKIRQSALKKLITEADKSTKHLEFLEDKIKEEKVGDGKDMVRKILILVNQGFSVQEISERMNVPVGEVELAVNLRKFTN